MRIEMRTGRALAIRTGFNSTMIPLYIIPMGIALRIMGPAIAHVLNALALSTISAPSASVTPNGPEATAKTAVVAR